MSNDAVVKYLDPDTNEDTRNVIDHFKYWRNDAIKAYLDKRRHEFGVAMWHTHHDINLGNIVRSANAFNAKKVYYIGKRQWDRRSAVGTHHYMDMLHVKTFEEVLNEWDGPLIAIEDCDDAENIFEFDWPVNSLIMLGQEANEGIPPEALAKADHTVYIPQYGSVRSLNVGVAAGIAMSHYMQQHGKSLE